MKEKEKRLLELVLILFTLLVATLSNYNGVIYKFLLVLFYVLVIIYTYYDYDNIFKKKLPFKSILAVIILLLLTINVVMYFININIHTMLAFITFIFISIYIGLSLGKLYKKYLSKLINGNEDNFMVYKIFILLIMVIGLFQLFSNTTFEKLTAPFNISIENTNTENNYNNYGNGNGYGSGGNITSDDDVAIVPNDDTTTNMSFYGNNNYYNYGNDDYGYSYQIPGYNYNTNEQPSNALNLGIISTFFSYFSMMVLITHISYLIKKQFKSKTKKERINEAKIIKEKENVE